MGKFADKRTPSEALKILEQAQRVYFYQYTYKKEGMFGQYVEMTHADAEDSILLHNDGIFTTVENGNAYFAVDKRSPIGKIQVFLRGKRIPSISYDVIP
jgi:hypothetical protein